MNATQFYSQISQKEVLVREPCSACSGSGVFPGRGNESAKCHTCEGSGKVTKWVKMADFAGLIREEEEKLR